jgi:hypothetical protein
MRKILMCLALAIAVPSQAATTLKITRVSSSDQRLNVDIQNAPLSAVVKALELHLVKPVIVETGADRVVTYRASRILPKGLLAEILKQQGLILESRGDWEVIRDPREPSVSMDVKDAEIGFILAELKRQCGIRNLMVDPEVKDQKGTFLFNEVPCTLAFKVVFNSLGLAAQVEPNSVLNVETPR